MKHKRWKTVSVCVCVRARADVLVCMCVHACSGMGVFSRYSCDYCRINVDLFYQQVRHLMQVKLGASSGVCTSSELLRDAGAHEDLCPLHMTVFLWLQFFFLMTKIQRRFVQYGFFKSSSFTLVLVVGLL